jgi:glycosyltransferase involved in cell wall biosynthesis
MHVSVVIPSYFRNSHKETVHRVQNQSLKPAEIIVVKNGEEEKDRVEVRDGYSICFTSTIGLNHARNRGAELARGDVIAFTDDDSLPDSDWVEQIAQLHGKHEQAPVIGGKIYPIWPADRVPPPWLKGLFLEYLTLLDYSEDLHIVSPADWIAGMNLSVKAWVFKQMHLWFDPDLDRKGENLLSNGETELFERIRSSGYEILYSPAMVVGHRITSDRMTPQFFLKRAYWQGVSDYLVDRKLHSNQIRERVFQLKQDLIHPSVTTLDQEDPGDHETLLAICNMQFAIGYLSARFSHETDDHH